MSEPRIISPLLDGFALGNSMSYHSGVNCYPAMRADSDERYIVKTISIPVSQTQLEALLLTGAYPNQEAARSYFHDLAEGIISEVEILGKLSAQRGFLPFLGYQVDPMPEGVGFEVYLVSHYRRSLDRFLKRSPMTHLSAVNMGIDLCAALAMCREAGYLYVDLKPSNIYLSGEQEYHIGDLGFVALDSLKYASLPDRCRSWWTPSEVTDAYAELNSTMDTYALGMVLYQVYNNGQLPFDSEESRQALMAKMENGEAMPAPMYADYEMAQIIAKACAFNPEERWQNPSDMGHALIAYMQRNGANDVPIGPISFAETAPLEIPAEEASEDESSIQESTEEEAAVTEEPAEEQEEAAAPEAAEETQAAEQADEAPAEEDWIDRMDAILSEDESDEAAEDEPSLRQLLTGDDAVPAVEEGEEVAAEELSEETADILSQADELIAQQVPEPVVAPEAIEIPMPEPIAEEEEEPTEAGEETDGAEDETDAGESVEEGSEEAEDKYEEEYGEDEPKPKGRLRKVLAWIAALALIAALGFGGYYFYTEYYLQEIGDLVVTGEADTMQVCVVTDASSELDLSLLNVVVVDQYGAKQTSGLTDGVASFRGLTPDTQYTVTLEIEGLRKLTGKTTAQYYTLPQTNVVSFSAVTGPEDGSVILNFAVEGPAVETWTVEYTAEGLEPASAEFTGTMVTITGLNPGTEYTFTLNAGDDVYMIGQTQLTYTATNVIYAGNLAITSLVDNTITVTWNAPEGIEVSGWTVRCYNESGYDQTLNVAETTASFSDIDTTSAYTIEVTAAGMTQSQRTYISANPINITALEPSISGGSLNVNWQFEGTAPEGGWLLVYTVDQGAEQHVVQCAEPTATISPIAPGSHYDLTVQAANSATVFGGITGVDVPQADAFAQLKLKAPDITATLVKAPAESGWTYKDVETETNHFAVGEAVGVTLFTNETYSTKDTPITTLFVVRDSGGKLVTISSSTESWADMWERGHCELNVPQVPTAPGTYSLQIYMGGQLLTTMELSIG